MTDRAYGAGAGLRNLALAALLLLVPAARATAEVRVLAFGDSLTAGFGLPEDQGFAPRLQAWLAGHGAPDAMVINAGVSGETTAGGLARIDWALGEDVDAVIVELGANDMLRGLDPAAAKANLDGILAAIAKRSLPAIVAGIPAPPNYGAAYQTAFNAIHPDLAEKYDAIYYPSFLAGIVRGRNGAEIMDMMQGDRLHPNARGVEAIVADIGPVVLELVDLARERRAAR